MLGGDGNDVAHQVAANVACIIGLHAHDVVARVNVENLPGDTAR